MTYFITGGSGLVGQWLLAALLRTGAQVRASYRSTPPTLLPEGAAATAVEWMEGNILDPLFLQEAVAGVDVVIHTAALVSFAPRDADRLWQINVEGTANVVNALLTHAPTARLLHVSSVAALGPPAPGTTTVTESSLWDEAGEHSVYAKSKFAAEQEVWRGLNEGLSGAIVNPSVIVGPGDPRRSSTQLFRYAAEEHRFYPPGNVNLVDVRDVVAALLALATAPLTHLGAQYVLSAGTLPYVDFFGMAATALGRRPPGRPLPPLLAEALWRIEAVRARLTGAAPLLTRETARVARRTSVFDGSRASRVLGVDYRSPTDSVAWAAAELYRHGLGVHP